MIRIELIHSYTKNSFNLNKIDLYITNNFIMKKKKTLNRKMIKRGMNLIFSFKNMLYLCIFIGKRLIYSNIEFYIHSNNIYIVHLTICICNIRVTQKIKSVKTPKILKIGLSDKQDLRIYNLVIFRIFLNIILVLAPKLFNHLTEICILNMLCYKTWHQKFYILVQLLSFFIKI